MNHSKKKEHTLTPHTRTISSRVIAATLTSVLGAATLTACSTTAPTDGATTSTTATTSAAATDDTTAADPLASELASRTIFFPILPEGWERAERTSVVDGEWHLVGTSPSGCTAATLTTLGEPTGMSYQEASAEFIRSLIDGSAVQTDDVYMYSERPAFDGAAYRGRHFAAADATVDGEPARIVARSEDTVAGSDTPMSQGSALRLTCEGEFDESAWSALIEWARPVFDAPWEEIGTWGEPAPAAG